MKKTEDEWRGELSPDRFHVPESTAPNRPDPARSTTKRDGTFKCAGCGQPLFAADTKFESGTGAELLRPMENAVGETVDRSLFMTRTEVHRAQCGGHSMCFDGPAPTGSLLHERRRLDFEPKT
jgi:peptide-methionine (R)-S-oxide reductase